MTVIALEPHPGRSEPAAMFDAEQHTDWSQARTAPETAPERRNSAYASHAKGGSIRFGTEGEGKGFPGSGRQNDILV